MSTTNAPAYCEVDDVRKALQETSANMDGPLGDPIVESSIIGASQWLAKQINAHWYDTNAAAADLIDTSAKTMSDIILSVPSSPHAQRGQLFRSSDTTGGTRYPNTHAGRYCRIKLPLRYAQSIDTLEVRGIGGETVDWVASSAFTEGRGEDYYLQTEGQDSYGRSHLFVHAASLGPHISFDDVLDVEVTYGLDWNDTPWNDVRSGIASVAGAQLIDDDDILTQIPDSGQLISVETKAQNLLKKAFERPGYLSAYVPSHPVA